ncbi:alpha/beta fold hydrolase [Dictyobacter formicarum]|uniref:Dihydrolipoamide acetyltransferase n=1 Tax=Dictyobacter formicarum TaxID=2778368 RepID=A0ABQ3VBN4_9CHLR|nr:alpha/beta fold hydrolase [Dictyobacter formicarum]GHO83570.1 dihydrolipoamide acetyltransferase [Dictyobacter formicarum]
MKMHKKIVSHTVFIEERPVHYQLVDTQPEGQETPREAIVLVHGLSASSYWWTRNIAPLAQHYRLYLIDLPGFGSMRQDRRYFQLTKTASWLLQWMEKVELSRAHFIGHSMGGFICAELAARRPDVVGKLVLVAPAFMPPERQMRHYLLPLCLGITHTSPAFWPILTYDAMRTGPLTLLNAARQLMAQDNYEHISTLSMPTLLVWGKHDTLVPAELGQLLIKEIPQAQLVVLARAGHVCMFEQAPLFNKHVLNFLGIPSMRN